MGGVAELVIREMKEAYALGKIPTSDWQANQAYFQLVVFAYNLLNWFRRFCLPEPWQRLTLRRFASGSCWYRVNSSAAGEAAPQVAHSFPYQDEFLGTLRRIRHLKLPSAK